MNAELKAKWVVALRGGGYKQGRNRLRNKDEFCCLGVLCDVSGLGEWSYGEYKVGGDSWMFSPPKQVRAAAGLLIADEEDLTRFNDVLHHDFDWIADYVEKNL